MQTTHEEVRQLVGESQLNWIEERGYRIVRASDIEELLAADKAEAETKAKAEAKAKNNDSRRERRSPVRQKNAK